MKIQRYDKLAYAQYCVCTIATAAEKPTAFATFRFLDLLLVCGNIRLQTIALRAIKSKTNYRTSVRELLSDFNVRSFGISFALRSLEIVANPRNCIRRTWFSLPGATQRVRQWSNGLRAYIYNMSATHDVHVRELTSLCPRTSRMALRWRRLARTTGTESRAARPSSVGRGREEDRAKGNLVVCLSRSHRTVPESCFHF